MNLYESIKSNHTENTQRKSRFIKESAEGSKEFWDKVDAGEIKAGMPLDSAGAGDIDLLDLDKGADYILIKRPGDFQAYVAAWAPEFYDGKLTWGQGHYFDTEEDAREYFNKKALRQTVYESAKGRKLKESDHSAQMQNIIDKMKNGEYSDDELSMIYWFAQGPIVDDLGPGEVFSEDIINTEIDNADYEVEAHNYHYPDDIWDIPDHNMIKGVAKDFYGLTGEEVGKCFDEIDKIVHSNNSKKESCSKKKRVTMKESNPSRYLGVKLPLDEAINHANDDINAKIKEALRSKTAARKYKKDLEDAGIKIDDTPREGVNLIGPNGRMLSADRQNIYGPSRPGHGKTHDSTSRWGGAKSMREDLKSYDSRIKKDKEELDAIENMQRDDVIRKYSNKSTEEALDLHKKDIERATSNLGWDKRWRQDKVADLERLHRDRDVAHRSRINGYDREISRDAKYKDPNNKEGRGYSNVADAIDYKGYLDSKDNNENKDFDNNGRAPRTKGQEVRQKFADTKADVEHTYYWGSDARRDKEDKAIDAKAIEQRKKEIEEEYKKKMDDEVNSMLARKSKADASYAEHKNSYNDKVNKLNAMRSKLGLQTKDEQSFEDYLEKKSQSRY